jgi:glycosyltransferase involved in cell wall biosynthesis
VFHGGLERATIGPKRLFFYGRPGHPRNGFELSATALRMLKDRVGDRVEILCAGAAWNPREYGLDGVVTNLGLLQYHETAELYRSCHIGFVMMMTRHPSYLPFEFMACGGLLVSNDNPTNSWLLQHGYNCLLAPASGPAIAERLARDGRHVVLASRSEGPLKDLAASIAAAGGSASVLAVDVGDAAALRTAVEGMIEERGRLDIVVNNAGITRDNLSLRMSDEEFTEVIGVNLTSAFVVAAALASCSESPTKSARS